MALVAQVALVALVALGCAPSGEKDSAQSREPAAAGKSPGATGKSPGATARGAKGEVILHLDKEAQQQMGLVVATPIEHEMVPELVAYGRVMLDPSTSFTVRAPIAGTLMSDGNASPWPAVGTEIRGGGDVLLGVIRPRLSAVERADVSARLAAARGDLASSRASLVSAKSALERTRALNAENKNASDRAVEEADARVKSEEARGTAAAAAIETLQSLLEPGAETKASIPVSLSSAGTVVEVLAHPGESVDAGAPLLRVENFDRLLARIDMPVDGVDHAAPDAIRIAAVGSEEQFVQARRVGPAANVDVANQGGAVLYAFEPFSSLAPHSAVAQSARSTTPSTAPPVMRPGQAVVAWIPTAPSKQKGHLVPRSAVVRFAGKAWVFDATGDEEFTRREIEIDRPTELGWFVSAAWAGKSRVVVTGAAELLSEEILGTQAKHGEEP